MAHTGELQLVSTIQTHMKREASFEDSGSCQVKPALHDSALNLEPLEYANRTRASFAQLAFPPPPPVFVTATSVRLLTYHGIRLNREFRAQSPSG